jgi:hypothetical protein
LVATQCSVWNGRRFSDVHDYYASKLTQTEDKFAYCRAVKMLYKWISPTEEDAAHWDQNR